MLPSLVATEEEEAMVGFIASRAHRLRLGNRDLRAACCSHLVVDPANDTAVLVALVTPGALLTRLDGEWW